MGPHQNLLGIWRRNYETGVRSRVICWFSEPETGLDFVEQIAGLITMQSQTQKRPKLSQEAGVRGFLEGFGGDQYQGFRGEGCGVKPVAVVRGCGCPRRTP